MDISKFTEFGKIKDICWNDSSHDKKGLNEFLTNIVMNNNYENGYGKMLPNLSDIYVLISNHDFPFDTLPESHSIDLSASKKSFVLGYIWLCPWILENEECIPIHFINFKDSRISGLNIAKYMIEKYEENDENEAEKCLMPYEVMIGAENYWKKYFMDEYNIKNKIELENMIDEFTLKKDIKWDHLLLAFEM